jgi:phosphoesterase RecJ-like protein
MAIDWAPFLDLIKKHQRFLITTHIRPDADGLGSMLGLAEVLEKIGKQVQMVIASTWPPRYDFLDPDKRIQRFKLPGESFRQTDAVIVLDTGTWNQLGDFGTFMKSLDVPKLVIDHHISFDDLSATRLADTSSEATARLVYEAIQALRQPVPERAANNLFVGLAMDTGWFRHPNTTPATFALADKLVQAGARPTPLYEHLFEENTLPRLKLTGLVLDRLQTAEHGRLAFSEIRKADYAATGAVPQDTEDLVNYTRSLAGVDVGLFFMEQPAGGVKVSFRARTVDVAKVAEQFGGGGHRLASGAILQTSLDEAKNRVLDAVRSAMK